MATNTDNNGIFQQGNTVVVVNFSNDGEHTLTFKQSLIEQATFKPKIIAGDCILLTLDNKYYSAEISLSFYGASDNAGINHASIDDITKILCTAQAVVILIDSREESWSLLQELWSEKLSKECTAEVQLVCVYGDGIQCNSEHPCFLWTVKEHFEFIPMREQTDSIEDDYSFLKEKIGIARLLEALQTHVWSDIQMKDNSPRKQVATEKSHINGVDTVRPQKSENKIDSLLDEMSVASELNGEDDSFDKLLGKLMGMRQQAAALEGEERKDFAEKVVNLFMNALADDEDD